MSWNVSKLLKEGDEKSLPTFSRNMAVLQSSDAGWVISHELFINDLYGKTRNSTCVKSYSLNPRIFDIQIPFVRKKKCSAGSGSEETMAPDVKTVKSAYENMRQFFDISKISSSAEEKNNRSARAMSDDFYCRLTRHPEFKFLGGNDSTEALVTEIGNELYLIPSKSLFYCYDIGNVSEQLKDKKFDLVLMDPPWWNKFIRRKRKKNSKFGYDMLYDQNISSIPINSLLNNSGLVAVWCTSAPSHIDAVVNELFPAWNIEFITQWFWLKVTKFGQPICQFSEGLGKQPFERIIFGRKREHSREYKNPEKEKVIMSVPSAIHSHKPPLLEVLKPYLPSEPKCLELFARYLLPAWTSYGNEVLKLQHISIYNEAPHV